MVAALAWFALPGLSSARGVSRRRSKSPSPAGCCAPACRRTPRRAAIRSPGDEASLADGAALFQQKCEVCHAYDGGGKTRDRRRRSFRAPPALRAAVPSLSRRRDVLSHPQRHPEHRHAGLGLAGSAGLAAGRCTSATCPRSRPLQRGRAAGSVAGAHYVGSQACQTCHQRDLSTAGRRRAWPTSCAIRSTHPDAIIPDLTKPDPLVDVHQGRHRLRLRQPLEAALFQEGRRRLFPAAGAVGRRRTKIWRRISCRTARTGGRRSIRRDNMQRPTGPLCDGCHSVNYDIDDQDRHRVECRLRAVPRRRAATHVAQPDARNIVNPARLDYVARQRHLHPVPLAGPAARAIPSRANITTGRSGYRRRPEAVAISGSSRSTSSARPPSPISPTAPRTRTACRATTSCRA